MGGATAIRLAREGFAVGVTDINDASETVAAIREAGGTAAAYSVDVRDWDAVGQTVAAVERDLGPIEALASVVGVWEYIPFLEMTPESWHRIMDVNLEGTFNVVRRVSGRMAERGAGAIVCVSSNAAQMAWEGGAHYSASKAGMLGLVRGMAMELGPHGVRVNAVCPGTVLTPANAEELADPAAYEVQRAACPIGRIGQPSDIAEAITFLLDSTKSGWITGETMIVDGGFGTHGAGAEFGVGTNSTTG
jgi:3-oxoacyl-[acyl-carrier protein] reductase